MKANPTSILISGAFGQVGRRATALLLSRGRIVIALDVSNEATQATASKLTPAAGSPGRLVPAFVNLLDADAVDALVAQHRPEAIIHLAAVLAPTCYSNPAQARRVNVDGTANLVHAAKALAEPPLFLECSSSAVYGSRNPHSHRDRLNAYSPINPSDCYGEDKVAAEGIVTASGLPFAIFRLGGVMSPDMLGKPSSDASVLSRAIPRDNRIHMVDANDVALAFANAVDRAASITGKTLMIAGGPSCALDQQGMMDDIMQAMGIGRIGAGTALPGDPNDDRGWFITDWFDTSEAQALLDFQQHTWKQTLDDIAGSLGRRRLVNRCLGPFVRPLMRISGSVQRRKDGRGAYADPWKLIAATFGPSALAQPTEPQG